MVAGMLWYLVIIMGIVSLRVKQDDFELKKVRSRTSLVLLVCFSIARSW